jgi:hypothetical protein
VNGENGDETEQRGLQQASCGNRVLVGEHTSVARS